MDKFYSDIQELDRELEEKAHKREVLQLLNTEIIKNGIDHNLAVQLEEIGIPINSSFYPTHSIGYHVDKNSKEYQLMQARMAEFDRVEDYNEIFEELYNRILKEKPSLMTILNGIESAMKYAGTQKLQSYFDSVNYSRADGTVGVLKYKTINQSFIPYEKREEWYDDLAMYFGSFIVAANLESTNIDDYFNPEVTAIENEYLELMMSGKLRRIIMLIKTRLASFMADDDMPKDGEYGIYRLKDRLKELHKLQDMKLLTFLMVKRLSYISKELSEAV